MRSSTSLLPALLLPAALILAACGDDGGTGGSGGAGAAGGSTSSAGGSGGGGGSGVPCGGIAGAMCGATEYCEWADDSCGGDDGQGVCTVRPEACPEDCPGVCGCDNQFYCNGCIAQAAGVDVSALASCQMGGAQFSAYYWPGGLDHLIVLMADPAANTCTMVYIDAPSANAPAYDVTLPAEWGVTNAQITDNAADCAAPMSQPTGQVFLASAGTGTLSWVVEAGMVAPCTLDVSLTLQFPGGQPWVPPSLDLAAVGVTVDGACP